MRFLLIAPRFHTNLYFRVIALQNAGHKVLVLVLYKGKSEYYKDIEIRQLKRSLFSRIFIRVYQKLKKNYLKTTFELFIQSPGKDLKKEIKAYKPDYVLLKAFQNILAIKTLFVAKRYGLKVLMFIQTSKNHIIGSRSLFKFNMFLFKKLNVNTYITPVLNTKIILNQVNIKNIYYVPFVFSVKKNEIQKNLDKIKIISVGKFVKRKDQLLLLNVFKLLQKKHKISLDLYGEKADSKYYQENIDFIEENNLTAKIKIHLNVPYKNILNAYKEYHVFVLPSYSEPASYSIVEAMANGLAIICSNENGTKHYIKEGRNGYIFKAKNEDSLLEKLEDLISNKDRLIKMQKESLNLAIKNHSLEKYSLELLKTL